LYTTPFYSSFSNCTKYFYLTLDEIKNSVKKFRIISIFIRMKKILPILLSGFIFLSGCNDKPEVQPTNTFDLQVYPNPVIDKAFISVRTQNTSSFTLKAFGTSGELLLDEIGIQDQQQFILNLSDKPKGKYQVILKTDKSNFTKTVIKL